MVHRNSGLSYAALAIILYQRNIPTSLQHVHCCVIPLIVQTLKNTPELILQLTLQLKLAVIQF